MAESRYPVIGESHGRATSDSEKALLGAILRKPELIRQVNEVVVPKDFSEKAHREIFAEILRMQQQGMSIDLITLDERVSAHFPDMQVSSLLVECLEMCPAPAIWHQYADSVLEASQRRRLITIANRIVETAADPESDLETVITGAKDAITSVRRVRSDWVDTGEVLLSAYEDIEKRSTGEIIPCASGLANLDNLIGGFFPGEMTIIGARPGVGKTAFGMFCATSSASNGRKVCVASAEMTDTQMGTRLMADASGVNANRLRKAKYIQPEDWQAMSEALTRWGEMPISFLFARELETITAQVRSQHDRGQCEMLLVDYAQLLTTRKRFRDGDFMRIGYISKEIKRLAVDLRIPVILLAQVGRQEKNSLPTLSELKGSGSLEEDADNVIFLHRIDQQGDEALPEDMREPWRRATLNGAKVLALSIAKQRQGETGKVFAAFDSAHMRYTPLKP